MPAGRVALWVASIGAVTLTVRSLLWEAVPLNVAIAALAGYVGLALLGVLVPRLEMYGDVICSGDPARRRRRADLRRRSAPSDAPGGARDPRQYGRDGDDFSSSVRKAERHPDVVHAIIDGGHTSVPMGTITTGFTCSCRRNAVVEAIRRTQADRECCWGQALWFRPPVGQVSPRTVAGGQARRGSRSSLGQCAASTVSVGPTAIVF